MCVPPKKNRHAHRYRAVCLVRQHRWEHPSLTAPSAAIARQFGIGHESVTGEFRTPILMTAPATG